MESKEGKERRKARQSKAWMGITDTQLRSVWLMDRPGRKILRRNRWPRSCLGSRGLLEWWSGKHLSSQWQDPNSDWYGGTVSRCRATNSNPVFMS